MKLIARRILLLALLAVVALVQGTAHADFLRGDANRDGRVDISDSIRQLGYLFLQGPVLTCDDAADADDDGRIDIEDALLTLRVLFSDGEVPSPGSREPGPDPTCDPLGCADAPDPTPAVVLSELHYHPLASQLQEYIEVHNRSGGNLDVGGWRFTEGIALVIPPGTVIPAKGFLLVLKDPEGSRWRQLAVPKVGPYGGSLADGGERLTLVDGDCQLETLRYDDRPFWPAGPDGRGPSLERIDYRLPAGDYHAWRTSTARQGTPGEPNSRLATPSHPMITVHSFRPPVPSPSDPIEVQVSLDLPPERLSKVTLRWQALSSALSEVTALEMSRSGSGAGWSTFSALLPPQPSQTLVLANVAVELPGGAAVILPDPAEPQVFLACFSYGFEIESSLPVMWLYPRLRSGLFEEARLATGAVILEPRSRVPQVFAGAQIRAAANGLKLKFLKGEEYRGDRTLNIIPEEGGGGTGSMAPHMEQLGFQVFRDLGGIAPRADWFRAIDFASVASRHTQRLVIQQVNERFLEMNGLDPEGDLYKLDKNNFAKKTNLDTGLAGLLELRRSLVAGDAESRRQAVLTQLDLENVGLYSIISILIENWDGFHNNMYLYHDLSPRGRWMVFPWDLDQVFEVGRSDFPVTFPLTGTSSSVSREAGPISRPYHLQPDLDLAYREGMAQRVATGGPFTREAITARIDAVEALLLEDLTLQEVHLGAERAVRRAQIRGAYASMRLYLERRIPYLEEALR